MLRAAVRELEMRASGAASRASRRLVDDMPLLVPKTLAATVSWFIALLVADHAEPFFAPIAAVVALNAPLGYRGVNAVRVVTGIVIGIVVGTAAFRIVGGGYGTLTLATFAAMVIATIVGGARPVVGQSASGAILTVVAARSEVGSNHLEDALIGAGVALVFSQFLFSPEPVRLLRRAESMMLREMSIGLALTADAFEDGAARSELLDRALEAMRTVRLRLTELAEASVVSDATARHSPIWRLLRRPPLAHARAEAARLDMLGASCLMLARMLPSITPDERRRLAPRLRVLSEALDDVARSPGARDARERAAERVLATARASSDVEPMVDAHDVAARVAVRTIASDLIAFAHIEPHRA
ncbi:FUSC family protein [Sandaracinus amylolyticus]|uniref:FUSC family protein n=1 Tax=Sandaracinus amylolyticus TaxID=927083 RepID=UPI001F478327|nr:FUSC family protein [Sandaracinus amylolyticus]